MLAFDIDGYRILVGCLMAISIYVAFAYLSAPDVRTLHDVAAFTDRIDS